MNVPALDKCPGYNLYISGFIALRRPQALKNANITHIVSVLDWKFDDDTPLIRGYRHLHIPVDDVEDENLLRWFPQSNAFIKEGLNYWHESSTAPHAKDVALSSRGEERGSGVLIHCAMGKSRSATILLAYLLWSSRQDSIGNAALSQKQFRDNPDMVPLPTKPLTVIKALELLRRGRPIAEPNEGFMDQLHMYEDMGCPTTEAEIKNHKIYRRWMNKRSVEESLRVNMAPEMAAIIFEDESDQESSDGEASPRSATESATQGGKDKASQGEIKGKNVKAIAPGIKAPDGTISSSSSSKPSAAAAAAAAAASSSTSADATSISLPTPQVTIKCRKCRHILATTPFIQTHIPPPHTDPAFHTNTNTTTNNSDSQQQQQQLSKIIVGSPSPKCAHVFLHPLSWMRPVLSDGQMEGRLTCPKCSSNIGKFAWSGLRCSCGGWVTPGFGVARGKVDEVVIAVPRGRTGEAMDESSHSGSNGSIPREGGGGGGIAEGVLRLPPGMRKGGGNL